MNLISMLIHSLAAGFLTSAPMFDIFSTGTSNNF